MNIRKFSRKMHYWGSLFLIIPLLIIIFSGILLLLKKNIEWIQPSTIKGQGLIPSITMNKILLASKSVHSAKINNWQDIKRVDLRPSEGVIKILAKNNWEIQIDHQTGKILQSAYRRSDTIEGWHDGTFFNDKLKLLFFLPAAIILLMLVFTGIHLFIIPYRKKKR